MQIRILPHASNKSLAFTRRLMATAFPVFERRSDAQLQAALSDSRFELLHIEALDENNVFQEVGFVALWHLTSVDYIEHLAVDSSLRGKGVGSLALKTLFGENVRVNTPVVLEIDPRETPIAVRRAHFYERLRFVINPQKHCHPPYRLNAEPHELELLSLGRILTEAEHASFVDDLQRRVMRIAVD